MDLPNWFALTKLRAPSSPFIAPLCVMTRGSFLLSVKPVPRTKHSFQLSRDLGVRQLIEEAITLAENGNAMEPIPSSDIVRRIARALDHPSRIQILENLAAEGIGSASTVSKRSDLVLGNAAYHFRVLHEKCGLVEVVRTRRVRGALETFYRLAPAHALQADWSKMPAPLRSGLEGSLLMAFTDASIAALESGALDERKDTTFTYRPLALDKRGLNDSNRAIRKALEVTMRAERESRTRLKKGDGKAINAIVGAAVFQAAPLDEGS
jgi:DNA-binding transcriptional ArsR family regulator